MVWFARMRTRIQGLRDQQIDAVRTGGRDRDGRDVCPRGSQPLVRAGFCVRVRSGFGLWFLAGRVALWPGGGRVVRGGITPLDQREEIGGCEAVGIATRILTPCLDFLYAEVVKFGAVEDLTWIC